jgi:hypothetical protein
VLLQVRLDEARDAHDGAGLRPGAQQLLAAPAGAAGAEGQEVHVLHQRQRPAAKLLHDRLEQRHLPLAAARLRLVGVDDRQLLLLLLLGRAGQARVVQQARVRGRSAPGRGPSQAEAQQVKLLAGLRVVAEGDMVRHAALAPADHALAGPAGGQAPQVAVQRHVHHHRRLVAQAEGVHLLPVRGQRARQADESVLAASEVRLVARHQRRLEEQPPHSSNAVQVLWLPGAGATFRERAGLDVIKCSARHLITLETMLCVAGSLAEPRVSREEDRLISRGPASFECI